MSKRKIIKPKSDINVKNNIPAITTPIIIITKINIFKRPPNWN